MSVISQQTTAVTGDTITAGLWNTEFLNIINDYNGSITNANIASNAAIALSKVSTGLSGSVVGTTDTQTLTNKTLTSQAQTVQTYTPGAGATQAIDLSLGSFILLTMPAGNVTLTFSNGKIGQFFVIRVLQDSVGSRTVSWPGGVTWADGNAPTLTTTASKADMMGFSTPASATAWDGCVIFQNR